MRLKKARIQNYRSIRDTGWFDVDEAKTILVGPNEAGKTAILEALQRINAAEGVEPFSPLRDYPRKLYNEHIQLGRLKPASTPVASAEFVLEPEDLEDLPDGYADATYQVTRQLDNSVVHSLEGGPSTVLFTDEVRKDLRRMANYVRGGTEGDEDTDLSVATELEELIDGWHVGKTTIDEERADALAEWLESIEDSMDESDTDEDARHTRLLGHVRTAQDREAALQTLWERVPVFVYYSDYFRVRPNLHLGHFATRQEQNLLDDDRYDYGNECLLKLLGFEARELANLGDAPDPADDADSFEDYRVPLDERSIQLNAASTRLTSEIRKVWNPGSDRPEADTVRVVADGQYLKVSVQDELGVEIEFDQRSAGFQWLVSFFVVFFAEAADSNANAILLLDEPGLSLHGLKQRQFRETVSQLAEGNQTIYTTHSPFLVGPDELDLVRVVEMNDRDVGSKVHAGVLAEDPAALLPLQEALGYDLAQSLFMHQRNLVLEGLTDYWYLEATSQLLRSAKIVDLDTRISLVPAGNAGKVVYFATILHANQLKVAALLDSDNAGEAAANQETLIHTLGNNRILRTSDVCPGDISKPEVEDLLRDTLATVANDEFGVDVTPTAMSQPSRPIVDIFADEIPDFSKYRLGKAFLKWTRDRDAGDLAEAERDAWEKLIRQINRALK
ncbi:MAG: AAA family ATPase [Acidimicrobiaceae bacterium]|nr:AAA family ATPase [Acidimicrobiaceae bacterium]